MSVNFNNHNIITSGNLTALSGIFTTLQVDGGSVASYTAGSGLQLNGFTFDAKTATTSSSGITILSNTINSDENKALTPKAIDDAGYVDGTGTTNYIVKWSDSNTLTNGIIYDDGTNVGIGTSSPSSKLHVNGNATFSASSGVPVTITNNGTGNSFQVNDGAGDTTPFVVDADGKVGIRGATPSGLHSLFNTLCVGAGGTAAQGITVFSQSVCTLAFGDTAAGDTADSARGYVAYTHTTDTLTIGTNNATRITVDSTGQVGIGTSTPSAKLNVENGNVIFNDLGGNYDFRVEGDTDPNLLFVDASVDDVGIGTNTPAAKLHIAGDTLYENLSYRRFTTSTNTTTHFRKYYDIAHYANSVSSIAGSLRIEIPVTTSTMWSMDVVIVEYDGVNDNNIKTTNLTITGYSTNNLNRGVWTNNPSRINQVRFGRKSGGGSTIILIDPTSTFRYPKAYIKEINTHHSNETTFSNSANYSITITSDETDFILNGTITNDQFIRDDKLVNTFGNQTVAGNKTFNGNFVVNETGGNFDFRVEGDTDPNLLFVDASTDRVGIGTSTPSYKLDVNGDIGLTNGGLYSSPTGTIIGTNGWIYQSGQIVNSQGSFVDDGDAQSSQYILRTSTTNNTWTPVKNNGSDAILLASNRTYSFSINIVGRRTNGQDNAGYKLEGVLYNDGYGADFVGSTTKTVLAESDSAWDVRVSISGAGAGGSDYLLTEVLGVSSKNINWVAKVDLLEVGGDIEVDGYSYTELNTLSLDDSFIP